MLLHVNNQLTIDHLLSEDDLSIVLRRPPASAQQKKTINQELILQSAVSIVIKGLLYTHSCMGGCYLLKNEISIDCHCTVIMVDKAIPNSLCAYRP